MPCRRAQNRSEPTEAASTIGQFPLELGEVHGRRFQPVTILTRPAHPRLVLGATDDLELAVLHLHEGEAVGLVPMCPRIGRRRQLVLAGPPDRGDQTARPLSPPLFLSRGDPPPGPAPPR